jgi:hypothetical protein
VYWRQDPIGDDPVALIGSVLLGSAVAADLHGLAIVTLLGRYAPARCEVDWQGGVEVSDPRHGASRKPAIIDRESVCGNQANPIHDADRGTNR